MNDTDWTKWSSIAEIISSIAILITLVYLAVQTQQTNALLESQAQDVLRQNRVEYSRLMMADDELRDIIVALGYQSSRAEELGITLEQNIKLTSFTDYTFASWHQEFVQNKLVGVELPVSAYRAVADAYPFFYLYWDSLLKNSFPEDFREFMEEQVFTGSE